jgi:hypothetical protein
MDYDRCSFTTMRLALGAARNSGSTCLYNHLLSGVALRMRYFREAIGSKPRKTQNQQIMRILRRPIQFPADTDFSDTVNRDLAIKMVRESVYSFILRRGRHLKGEVKKLGRQIHRSRKNVLVR